ncbi:MAG: Macrolide export ATP-binding/permease protein MacB [Dehalococcoidia bacterium]|nr:Macrolide export ATP-binding/permease protein MacB [Chloroflexota bacterium]
MLMSVMERTREIGIMKAIGATNGNILSQFLLEAGTISLIGGILGCIVGAGIAKVVSLGITEYVGMEMPWGITLWVLTGGVLIAIIVGVLSALYPAGKAMKMNPVEAMRRRK